MIVQWLDYPGDQGYIGYKLEDPFIHCCFNEYLCDDEFWINL